MGHTIKFTDLSLRALKASESGQVIYWFDGMPGFGVRVGVSGKKSFISKIGFKGKDRKITHGTYPAMALRAAREQHEAALDRSRRGLDPDSPITAAPADGSVDVYSERFFASREKRGLSDQRGERQRFKARISPVIGSLLPEAVTASHIRTIQDQVIDVPLSPSARARTSGGRGQAYHVMALLRVFFAFLVREGVISESPVPRVENLGKIRVRERVLTSGEIWTLWHGLGSAGLAPSVALALKMVLATMQRSGEVRALRWDHLDPGAAVWTIPASGTKNRRSHRVPLNTVALSILEAARAKTGKAPFVFASTFRVQNLRKERSMGPENWKLLEPTSLAQAMRRKLPTLGLADVTPHDLRRTGATLITAMGLPPLYASLMLNHVQPGVTSRVYVQYSYDFEKRRAADLWAFVLSAIIAAPSAQEVPGIDALREMVKAQGLI